MPIMTSQHASIGHPFNYASYGISDPLDDLFTFTPPSNGKAIPCFSSNYSIACYPPSPPPSLSIKDYLSDSPEFSPFSPSSLLDASCSHTTSTTNTAIIPRVSCTNNLIDINLDPPSPLLLSTCASSVAALEEAELDLPFSLALEDDPVIVDKFQPPPLLADPEAPESFIATTPVHESVEDLLRTDYPHLVPNSVQYAWHLQRLRRNRAKLALIRETLDQARRKRMSERSASFGQEEKRFRARR